MIKVVGIGSPFGDDQVGLRCVEILQSEVCLQNYIANQMLSLEMCDRPGVGLINVICDATVVFLIDAVKTGAEIGTVHRLQNQEIESATKDLSSHGFGVGQVMQMGRVLNALPTDVVLYGVEIGEVGHFSNLSDKVDQAKHSLVALLIDELMRRFDR